MTLKEYIRHHHNGNKLNAAHSLGISRRMLYLYLSGKSFPVRQKAITALKSSGIEVPTL